MQWLVVEMRSDGADSTTLAEWWVSLQKVKVEHRSVVAVSESKLMLYDVSTTSAWTVVKRTREVNNREQ